MSSFPAPRPLQYVEDRLKLSGADLAELAAEYGTPLYAYSADDLRDRVAMFVREFSPIAHTVCYAVKANSSLALLRLLGELGCGFDIVSGGELERVRRAAPEALSRVVFSGVGKQAWEMDAALMADILLFNVESEAELALLAERANALGKRARFALRVNPNVAVETHPYISTGLREHKFGIAIERARALYAQTKNESSLDAAGVSVHIGSQIREVAPFVEAIGRVAALVRELRADGHAIRYLDAGGGFGIEYGQAAFDPVREVKRYAGALMDILGETEIHLLLEPGRFLIAQAGVLLTRVLYGKVNGSKPFVIADAAMNDLIRPALYGAHHEVLPVIRTANGEQAADLVGPVCESGDFFARDRVLPRAHAGDLLAVLDAGAYGMSLSSNYNTRVRPAEVLVEGGSVRLIRMRETLDDLLVNELF
ncbi:MAG: diaminopimelate decarboxylase [Janthinobacterium lividum]